MPNERERVRLEVTFEGGHAIAVLVATDAADGLRRALEGERDAVFELEADDGRYFIPLRNVVYVKRFSRDTQIGFGGTA
jgi:hypothetical protein